MQAALITYLPTAPNSTEPVGEAASAGHGGRGMRINSELQAKTADSLFTTILQNGITINTALSLSAGTLAQSMNTDLEKDAEGEDSTDICSLLMQQMVMNSTGQAAGGDQNNPNEQALHGISSIVNEISGTAAGVSPEGLDAAALLLQKDGTAAQTPAPTSASAPLETVLAGITDALESALAQNDTAGDAAAANADARGNGIKLSSQVKASEGATPDSGKDAGAGRSSGPAPREKSDGEAAFTGNSAFGMQSGIGMKVGLTTEKTSAVERALNKFADDLMSIRGGSREIRIVLEPESLGVLTISVIKTESGISAKIRSEDKEIAAIISDHVQKLISSMQSKGITVSDVDVTYGQAEQNTGFTQHGFSQAREEASKGYTLPPENAGEDAPESEIWQTLYGDETGGDTTVDYRV